jgi:hypothetical protein
VWLSNTVKRVIIFASQRIRFVANDAFAFTKTALRDP